jgi:hypothetical protein
MTVLLVLAPGVSAHAGGRSGGARYQLTHTSEDDPVDLNGDRWIRARPSPSPIRTEEDRERAWSSTTC